MMITVFRNEEGEMVREIDIWHTGQAVFGNPVEGRRWIFFCRHAVIPVILCDQKHTSGAVGEPFERLSPATCP